MEPTLELDGSMGEGGGQILRTSLALALLTGRAFHLKKVRAGRDRPGLQPQHLMSVRAAAEVGQAKLRGAARGSTDLVFEPGEVKEGAYRFDIGTAGATGLVLQTVYLPLALRGEGPSALTLIGGTHVRASPCFHFLEATWRRYLAACGLALSLKMQRPGFYPRGGGVVEVQIQPCTQLRGITLTERGAVTARVTSVVAGLDVGIGRRQARRAKFRLEQYGLQVAVREEMWDDGPGTVALIELDTTPAPTLFFALGERGKPAERVADEACNAAIAFLDAGPAPVDAHSADQLVLPLALAKGASELHVAEVTRHLTTNLDVIRKFIDRTIVCEGDEGTRGVVRIE